MRYETFPAARVGELVARGVQLVDVREPHEYAASRHPDAVSIPLGELRGASTNCTRTGRWR